MKSSNEHKIKRNVLKMLNMTETELDKAVENINSWLQLQPHLPHTIDSKVIKSFIVGCRSIEVAKVKLEKYFLARINFPAEISNRDPFKIQWDNIQPLAYLPELTPEGYLVLVLTMPDLNKIPGFDFMQSIRLLAMMSEVVIRERPYITGMLTIVDLKHLSIKLLPKISISNVANGLYIFEHVYPFQMKAIYNFNTPQIADSLQKTLIKPIMNDGLYNTMQSSTEDERCLAKFVPVDILPQELGGKAPPLSHIISKIIKLAVERGGKPLVRT